MSSLRLNKRRQSNIISVSHISSISDDAQRTLIDFEVYLEVSAWLAWHHVVTSQSILPEIQGRLAVCDVDFQFTMRDTHFSAINAARQFLDAYTSLDTQNTAQSYTSIDTDNNITVNDMTLDGLDGLFTSNQSSQDAGQFLDAYISLHTDNNNNIVETDTGLDGLDSLFTSSQTSLVDQNSFIDQSSFLVGTVRSVESSAMSFLSSAYNIPQIASSSTASYLNNKDSYPLFARTAPTNQGDASAMVFYLKELKVSHVGVFYIADGYGNDFHADVSRELVSSNITVLSIQYEDSAMERAIQQFALSDIKYAIAILNPGTWRSFIRLAYVYKIIGRPDYFWMFGESSLELTDPSFRLDYETEADIAKAIHGSAVISATEPLNDIFDQQLLNFSENATMQQLYIDQHVEPNLFENYQFSTPGPSLYQYLTYDAVLASILATCDVQHEDVESSNRTSTGHVIYEQLLRTEFKGISGDVSFDPTTGTRQSKSILYGVRNVLLSGNVSSTEGFRFTSETSSIVYLDDNRVDYRIPFVYSSNSTTPPLSLPPVEIQLNLIPTSLLAFGWSVCGFVFVVSLFWIVWTFRNRNKDVVKASQPIFLYQICVGTVIIASAIIPMSVQEPMNDRGLDIACMATPWLISMGFVTTFSALFTKTWRLNKLFRNSRNMRRVVIRPRDVILPLIILIIVNFAVMLAWTFDAPLIWERNQVSNYDAFGRSIESVGRCVPSNDERTNVYLGLIAAIDLSLLIFSNYQAYLARTLPTEFSESTYITVAMASMLEICVLGIPLLFMVSSDPSIAFMIRSLLASVTSLSILLPIFLPKFIRRIARQRFSEAHLLIHGKAPRRSAIHIAGTNIHGAGTNIHGAGMNIHGADFDYGSDRFGEDNADNQRESNVSTQSPSKGQTGCAKIVRHEAYFQDLLASPQKNRRSLKKSVESRSSDTGSDKLHLYGAEQPSLHLPPSTSLHRSNSGNDQ